MANFNFWAEIIVALLTGLVAAIPLVIKLVQTIKDAVKAKNWTPLMQLLLRLMAESEDNYSTGAEKKAYVLDSIEAIKGTLNYDVDMEAVSAMIDAIAQASKRININKK
jgi:dsRNA-specific ribonuclease